MKYVIETEINSFPIISFPKIKLHDPHELIQTEDKFSQPLGFTFPPLVLSITSRLI